MKRSIVLIGPPGAGKGTQSAILVERFGFKHVSTGDLLRAEVAKGNELGSRIKTVMDSGDLVTYGLVAELLKSNIDLDNHSYIFDGFPRNVEQAKILGEEILNNSKYLAVYFDVDLDKLVQRVINRRVSSDGKHIYNLLSHPPQVDGVCDYNKEPLVQRKDDKEEVVNNRIKVYKNETSPMIQYYRELGLLKTVDADKAINDVTEQLFKILDEE